MKQSCDGSACSILPGITALVRFLPVLIGCLVFSCHSGTNPSPDKWKDKVADSNSQVTALLSALYTVSKLPDEDRRRGMAVLDSVFGTFSNPGTYELFKKLDYKRSFYFDIKKDPDSAMQFIDSQLFILADGKSEGLYAKEYGSAFFQKGDILMAQGKYHEAFLAYYKGREIIEKTRDICLLNGYSASLGTACYQQKKYQDALTYYRSAFDELLACEGQMGAFEKFAAQQSMLDNIALCHARNGLMDSAAYYYDSALRFIGLNESRFIRDSGDIRFIQTARAVIYGNQGDVYLKRGDFARAEAMYLANIRINSKKGHALEDAQLTMGKLANLYMITGRIKESADVLHALRRSLDSLPGSDAELSYHKMRWLYFDSTHNPVEAYGALQSYLRLKDSLDANNMPADVNAELLHIAHGYELDWLKKRNEVKNRYLVIAGICSAVIVFFTWAVWKNWRRSKKLVIELTKRNEEIKSQNGKMRSLVMELEHSEKEKTRMMKTAAHDLRNPVGAISSISSLLLQRKDIPKDQIQLVDLIRVSSLNSLELIDDLLIVNSGKEEIIKSPVDMQTELLYCVELLQFKAQNKNQRILLKTERLTILASREKIWRVLSNLITNAIKFSPENSSIQVEMNARSGNVLISIKDQGIGIPPEWREKVFDVFTGAKRRGTAGEESFGLGLSICRQIVVAHGGRIWFESELGKGTTFYVELPFDTGARLPGETAVRLVDKKTAQG